MYHQKISHPFRLELFYNLISFEPCILFRNVICIVQLRSHMPMLVGRYSAWLLMLLLLLLGDCGWRLGGWVFGAGGLEVIRLEAWMLLGQRLGD